MIEMLEMPLLSDEEQDSCTPTEREQLEYLSTPDDDVAKSLTLEQKRVVGRTILYGIKIAQAQRLSDLRWFVGLLKLHQRVGLEIGDMPYHVHFTMPEEIWQELKDKLAELEGTGLNKRET